MRRKRRKDSSIIAVTFIVFILIVALAGIVIYSTIKSKEPKYKYESLTEEITAKTYVWLNEIDDMELSYEDIRDTFGEIKIEIVLKKAKGKGMYIQSLNEESYNAAVEQIKAGINKLFKQVIVEKIRSEGFEGEISESLLESIMTESYKMTISEYIDNYASDIIPDKNTLINKYSGEVAYEK